jgi:glycosyltransferase involved in cell wall biosynthesis
VDKRTTLGHAAELTVANIGVVGDEPGGMAQVIGEYLSWPFAAVTPVGIRSTRGKGDRLSPIRAVAAVGKLLRLRSKGTLVAAVHMSQRGSFWREGGIIRCCRALGVPVCVHLHGSGFAAFAERHPLLTASTLRRANVVITLTNETTLVVKALLRNGRTPGPRVTQLWNAVSPPEGENLKSERIVLFAGEVGYRKGVDTLLEAWQRLPDDHGWTLLLAGPVSEAAKQLLVNLPEGVHVLGSLPRAAVLALESRAAIAVLPSRGEALPMFVLEAMSRGCAVVASRVGQLPDALEDGAGLLVPVDDPGALADAIAMLIRDEGLRRALGERAVFRVHQSFSQEALQPLLEREWFVTAAAPASRGCGRRVARQQSLAEDRPGNGAPRPSPPGDRK